MGRAKRVTTGSGSAGADRRPVISESGLGLLRKVTWVMDGLGVILFVLSFPARSKMLLVAGVALMACGTLLTIPGFISETRNNTRFVGVASSAYALLFVVWLAVPALHHSAIWGAVLLLAPLGLAYAWWRSERHDKSVKR